LPGTSKQVVTYEPLLRHESRVSNMLLMSLLSYSVYATVFKIHLNRILDGGN